MKRLIAALFVRAFVIGVLIGIIGACAAPAFSETLNLRRHRGRGDFVRAWPGQYYTNTDQRFKVFTRELNKAADQLHVARPIVNVVGSEEAPSPFAAGWIWVPLGGVPRYIRGMPVHVSIVWSQLMNAGNRRLQCWARHEMTHVLLEHEYGARNAQEAHLRHLDVGFYMETRWRQDSACMIGD